MKDKISITTVVKQLEKLYNVEFEEFETEKYQVTTDKINIYDALNNLKKIEPKNTLLINYENCGLIMFQKGTRGMYSVSKLGHIITLSEFKPLVYNQNFYK